MKVEKILLLHREFKGINLDDANELSLILNKIPLEISNGILDEVTDLQGTKKRTARVVAYINKFESLKETVDFQMMIATDHEIYSAAAFNLAISFRENLLHNPKLNTKQIFQKCYT